MKPLYRDICVFVLIMLMTFIISCDLKMRSFSGNTDTEGSLPGEVTTGDEVWKTQSEEGKEIYLFESSPTSDRRTYIKVLDKNLDVSDEWRISTLVEKTKGDDELFYGIAFYLNENVNAGCGAYLLNNKGTIVVGKMKNGVWKEIKREQTKAVLTGKTNELSVVYNKDGYDFLLDGIKCAGIEKDTLGEIKGKGTGFICVAGNNDEQIRFELQE